MKLLLIEDDDAQSSTVRLQLKQLIEGIEIKTIRSVFELQMLMDTQQLVFDAIVLDMMLIGRLPTRPSKAKDIINQGFAEPSNNLNAGFRCIQMLKETRFFEEKRIVVYSFLTHEDLRLGLKEHGLLGSFVEKTESFKKLSDVIRRSVARPASGVE